MSRIVQIQGDHPIFPGNACVHCLQPSTQQVKIVGLKENYHVRQVSMPFCADCIALREHKTHRQVQFEAVIEDDRGIIQGINAMDISQ